MPREFFAAILERIQPYCIWEMSVKWSSAGYAVSGSDRYSDEGRDLVYTFDADDERAQITGLLRALDEAGVVFKDLHTHQSSLEDIFVDLVRAR